MRLGTLPGILNLQPFCIRHPCYWMAQNQSLLSDKPVTFGTHPGITSSSRSFGSLPW